MAADRLHLQLSGTNIAVRCAMNDNETASYVGHFKLAGR